MAKRDYYELLGVARSATGDELKKAFRKSAMGCHPDRNPGNKVAEEKFKDINEAYSVLGDEQKRAAYDRFGHAAFENTGHSAGHNGNDPVANRDAALYEAITLAETLQDEKISRREASEVAAKLDELVNRYQFTDLEIKLAKEEKVVTDLFPELDLKTETDFAEFIDTVLGDGVRSRRETFEPDREDFSTWEQHREAEEKHGQENRRLSSAGRRVIVKILRSSDTMKTPAVEARLLLWLSTTYYSWDAVPELIALNAVFHNRPDNLGMPAGPRIDEREYHRKIGGFIHGLLRDHGYLLDDAELFKAYWKSCNFSYYADGLRSGHHGDSGRGEINVQHIIEYYREDGKQNWQVDESERIYPIKDLVKAKAKQIIEATLRNRRANLIQQIEGDIAALNLDRLQPILDQLSEKRRLSYGERAPYPVHIALSANISDYMAAGVHYKASKECDGAIERSEREKIPAVDFPLLGLQAASFITLPEIMQAVEDSAPHKELVSAAQQQGLHIALQVIPITTNARFGQEFLETVNHNAWGNNFPILVTISDHPIVEPKQIYQMQPIPQGEDVIPLESVSRLPEPVAQEDVTLNGFGDDPNDDAASAPPPHASNPTQPRKSIFTRLRAAYAAFTA